MGDQIMPVSIPMDIDTPTPTKESPSIQPFVLGKESQVAAIDSTSMTNLVSSRQKMPVWGNGRLEDNPNGWSMMTLPSEGGLCSWDEIGHDKNCIFNFLQKTRPDCVNLTTKFFVCNAHMVVHKQAVIMPISQLTLHEDDHQVDASNIVLSKGDLVSYMHENCEVYAEIA